VVHHCWHGRVTCYIYFVGTTETESSTAENRHWARNIRFFSSQPIRPMLIYINGFFPWDTSSKFCEYFLFLYNKMDHNHLRVYSPFMIFVVKWCKDQPRAQYRVSLPLLPVFITHTRYKINIFTVPTVLFYGLDDRGSIPGRGGEGIFSLLRRVHTGSGAHPASCTMGTRCSFPVGKVGNT
jgi:hypothetical protein